MSFKSIENKNDVYKKLCRSFRKHAMKIINFKMEKNEVINKRAAAIISNAKICYICKEKFEHKYVKDKKHCKNRDHCHYTGEYRGAPHSIYNSKCWLPREISIGFHN